LGIVDRDHEGFVIAARSTIRNMIADSAVAEAFAAFHAVEFCREMGFNDIILEGDALQIGMATKVEGNN
jgi:ribonuclease HI